ncbi:MAG: hypothetical protein ACLPTB_13480 [Acidimicrobiales bacterium]
MAEAAAEAAADGVPAAGPAGSAAFAELAASLREVITAPGSASLLSAATGPLTEAEVISNPSAPRGLVFRKPPDLCVRWNRPASGSALPSPRHLR